MNYVLTPEDGIYDWTILNGGKVWEASNMCTLKLMNLFRMLIIFKAHTCSSYTTSGTPP